MAATDTRSPIRTKPGQHGTLTRYRVGYDADPSEGTIYHWHCWAYSHESALDRFDEDDEGYTARWVAKVREDGSITQRVSIGGA